MGWSQWPLGFAVGVAIGISMFSHSNINGFGPAICLALLFYIADTWLQTVNLNVPEPYLDEVFHIPQAQKYCDGRFSEWDDKITTPPGLYLASLLWRLLPFSRGCSVQSLRQINVASIIGISFAACECRRTLQALRSRQTEKPAPHVPGSEWHTAINIGLFPVACFFSALYYTDLISTLLVLVAYLNTLKRLASGRSIWRDAATIVLGLGCLLMRQTNVFWVVVLMGGMEAVAALKGLKPAPVAVPHFGNLGEIIGFYSGRYSLGDIHDQQIDAAGLTDVVLCAASIGIAAICNPLPVLRQVWPYLVVFGSFAAFVSWNGGVVLGDKSNHVATLHLAQMLYIWPLFAFFSAPLFLPQLVDLIKLPVGPFTPKSADGNANGNTSATTRSAPPKRDITDPAAPAKDSSGANTSAQNGSHHPFTQKSRYLRLAEDMYSVLQAPLIFLPLFALAAILIVHFNTIIHPFTLADNRHYMFYVFRYTILRRWWIRYALVVPYTLCAWLCWKAIQGWSQKRSATGIAGKSQQTKTEAEFLGAPDTSTALLWFLTTTLSLMTAPLVEPRYFILPWIFWRMLVPAWSFHENVCNGYDGAEIPNRPLGLGFAVALVKRVDLRLVLETVWFLITNLWTMYMFLYQPFFWRAKDGTFLDDGRCQRFMW